MDRLRRDLDACGLLPRHPLTALPSRVHELGRLRLLDLVTVYLGLVGRDFASQAIRLGIVPGNWDRDRLIATIRVLEEERPPAPSRQAA